jgi:hypothetical protein
MFELNVAQLAGALSGAFIAVFTAVVYKMYASDSND